MLGKKSLRVKSVAVKKYSLKVSGDYALSKNFKVREFRSRCGADEILIDENLVLLLQKMRDEFGKILISSAYRTQQYNTKVGGVKNSQHVLGRAADITLSNPKHLLEAARYAEKIGFTGIGLDDRYGMFLHLDTRSGKSFFKYKSDGSTYSVLSFFKTVGFGSRGDNVKKLQTKLKSLGYKGADGTPLSVDGVFGKNTQYALENFQKAKGLTQDGIAGPKTWKFL